MTPLARARASSSSLLGPAGCEASICRRMAAASASHWRRYSSISVGWARKYAITAERSPSCRLSYMPTISCGEAPRWNARITSSSKTRLSPTRNTPGGSSRKGTEIVSYESFDASSFQSWSDRHGAGGGLFASWLLFSIQSCSHRRGVGGVQDHSPPVFTRPLSIVIVPFPAASMHKLTAELRPALVARL
jgi:hypothetical protein